MTTEPPPPFPLAPLSDTTEHWQEFEEHLVEAKTKLADQIERAQSSGDHDLAQALGDLSEVWDERAETVRSIRRGDEDPEGDASSGDSMDLKVIRAVIDGTTRYVSAALVTALHARNGADQLRVRVGVLERQVARLSS